MKLRLNGNSIRLRLGMSEVNTLVRDGSVVERVEFGPEVSPLIYELHTTDDIRFSATFEKGRMSILVPRSAVVDWAAGDGLSLRGSQPARGGTELSILIEKDLACRTRSSDVDLADTFPNPPDRADC